jgi:hypothetical protein
LLTDSFVIVNSNHALKLISASFSQTHLISSSLISCFSGGDVSINECVFSEISRGNGNGSVLNAHVFEKRKCEISNSTFTSCSVENEDSFNIVGGGALYIILEGGNLVVGSPSTIIKFINCTTPFNENLNGYGGGIYLRLILNSQLFSLTSVIQFDEDCNARWGKHIFIESYDLSVSVNTATISYQDPDLNDPYALMGFTGNNLNHVVALKIYLGYPCFILDDKEHKCPDSCVIDSSDPESFFCHSKCSGDRVSVDHVCQPLNCASRQPSIKSGKCSKDDQNSPDCYSGFNDDMSRKCVDACPFASFDSPSGLCNMISCGERSPVLGLCWLSSKESCYSNENGCFTSCPVGTELETVDNVLTGKCKRSECTDLTVSQCLSSSQDCVLYVSSCYSKCPLHTSPVIGNNRICVPVPCAQRSAEYTCKLGEDDLCAIINTQPGSDAPNYACVNSCPTSHFDNINGVCVLRGKCSSRHPDWSVARRCNENCFFNPQNSQCVDTCPIYTSGDNPSGICSTSDCNRFTFTFIYFF